MQELFSRVLAQYVREKKTLTLMEALRKMTLMPAQMLERSTPAARQKGRLQEGADADIVVFDPQTISDRSTFEKPMEPSVGVHYLLVGGTLVIDEGKLVPDVYPGRAIVGAGKAITQVRIIIGNGALRSSGQATSVSPDSACPARLYRCSVLPLNSSIACGKSPRPPPATPRPQQDFRADSGSRPCRERRTLLGSAPRMESSYFPRSAFVLQRRPARRSQTAIVASGVTSRSSDSRFRQS